VGIQEWGVSRKHCAVVRRRTIVECDLGAADRRQPVFPLAFRRHSSAPASRRCEVFRAFSTLIPKPQLFLFDKQRRKFHCLAPSSGGSANMYSHASERWEAFCRETFTPGFGFPSIDIRAS
jgi:hypothetical protein